MAPNALAYAALLIWPAVSLVLFRALGPSRGLLACILGGYLLLPPLPAGFYLPGLLFLSKDTIPALSALAICLALFLAPRDLLPRSAPARLLLAACFACPLLSLFSNRDGYFWGSFFVSGLPLREAVPLTLRLLSEMTPFLLGRALLAGEPGVRRLLWALVIGTLAYSLPMLVEVRLSPQINTWVYGFFQHSFEQMMRGGGFRPIVFLYHGLWVAFLTSTAVLAAVTLCRSRERPVLVAGFATIWLLMVLVLCKSMASLIYALLGLPLILLLPPRMQIHLAALLAVTVLSYPLLRQVGLVPTQMMVDLAEGVNPERAGSLSYRFYHEEMLLQRAMERPWFGWGGWGRNLILEADTGQIVSVPDGFWVIAIGAGGIAGYAAKFGLMCLPILTTWWRRDEPVSPLAAGGMLILAINMVDMLPNATLTPLTWLFAGVLLGWAERPSPHAAPSPARKPAAGLPVLLGAAHRGTMRTVLGGIGGPEPEPSRVQGSATRDGGIRVNATGPHPHRPATPPPRSTASS